MQECLDSLAVSHGIAARDVIAEWMRMWPDNTCEEGSPWPAYKLLIRSIFVRVGVADRFSTQCKIIMLYAVFVGRSSPHSSEPTLG